MGFIADSITADKIQGFEPARATPPYPIDENYPASPAVEASLTAESATEDDFWTYDREQIASFAEVDARFSALRVWRLAIARANAWSAWVVFTDKQLTAIAEANPSTLDELGQVPGISLKKISSYGQDVLNVLGEKSQIRCPDASESL